MTYTQPSGLRRLRATGRIVPMLAGCAALFAFALPARAGRQTGEGLVYRVTPRPDLTPPQLQVSVQAPVQRGKSLAFQMPVWSPGDYHLQNHGRYVRNLQAFGVTGARRPAPLTVDHPDSDTWTVNPGSAESVVVNYAVVEPPPGIFSDNVTVTDHYAFVNGPSAYLYLVGHTDMKSELRVKAPSGWSAEMPLPALAPNAESRLPGYSAPDYDTLADSPLVIADASAMVVREFEAVKRPHKVVFFHERVTAATIDALIPMLKHMIAAENRIMGGPPYERYSFFFDVGGGGGGLEHLNSARLVCSPTVDPNSYQGFVGHEFFHLWNVKRIRPAVLGPFDYIKPPVTRNLWFAEGVTEYYAYVALRRAGLTTREEFLSHYRRAIARMRSNAARLRVTADEASLRVWESNNSQGFGGLSYYAKGELIGLCLDLKLRHVTEGRRSLDDVMRRLMQLHAPPKPGFGEDEIRAIVSEIAGMDLSEFYDRLARSTDEMPFEECLQYAGLDLNLAPLPSPTAEQQAALKSWAGAFAE